MKQRQPIPTKIKRNCDELLERIAREGHPANANWKPRYMPVIGLFPGFEGDAK